MFSSRLLASSSISFRKNTVDLEDFTARLALVGIVTVNTEKYFFGLNFLTYQ